jgi:hypothetical protein
MKMTKQTTAQRKARLAPPVPAERPRIVTPSVRAERALSNIRQGLNIEIDMRSRHLAEWKARFERNPSSAFEWSQEAFQSAARLQICQDILAWLEQTFINLDDEYAAPSDRRVLEIVAGELRREVLRNAKWPERSTSPSSNEMSLHRMSARAEWLEILERKLEVC